MVVNSYERVEVVILKESGNGEYKTLKKTEFPLIFYSILSACSALSAGEEYISR